VKDWKALLAHVAPALASAIGGPLAGMATKVLSDKLLGKPDGTEEEIAAALTGADTATIIKLRELDLQFKKDMTQAGIDLEKLAMEDRASARSREVSARDSWTPRILGGAIVGGFLFVVFCVVTGRVELKDAMVAGMIGTVIGYLSAKADQVIGYYFGSSAGSDRKTELMGRAAAGDR